MAILGAWTCPRLYVGSYLLSALLKEMHLEYSADMLDATTFCSTTRINAAGMKSIALAVSGLLPAASAADQQQWDLFAKVGTDAVPVALLPHNVPVEGDRALFFKSVQTSFQHGGPLGQLLPFSASFANGTGTYPLVHGYALEPGTTARIASSYSVGTNKPGAVSASQYAYAALHVWAASAGDTLNVTISSAADAAFTSPTTRFTFTQVSGITSQYMDRVAGAITDTYWRTTWTIAGVDPSFTFAVVLGIL